MINKPIDTLMGAVVLLAGAAALYTAYASSQIKTVEGYKVTARFNKVGGLQEGNAVRIGGLQVGTIASQKLDLETYDAVLELKLRADVKLPKDTLAEVSSDGLLGGKYILLTPGKSKEMIPADGKIEDAKGVLALEEIVGRTIFSTAQQKKQ
jgi:phospholipid/cholesterol/gamma-HCH transport system substrate-binding protein